MTEAMKVCMAQSTDDRQPTGAVIVREGNIIGRGANQATLKNRWLRKMHEQGWCVRKILKIKSGEKYWLCPGCGAYNMHAEARAIFDAKKNGNKIDGADLYLWGHWWCCDQCTEKMNEAGIRNVYLLENSEVLFNRSNPNNFLGRAHFSKFL